MAKRKAKATEDSDPSVDHDRRVYGGRGVLFVVADDREAVFWENATTVSIIAGAINDALDNGQEDAEEIARWITTSSFNYEPSKRVRFNSVLRASDAIGAEITRKLYNSYNELAEAAQVSDLTASEKREAKAEARGFAEAVNIVLSPFTCEDPDDPRFIVWETLDKLTDLFEAEQRHVRRERDGKPQ